MGRTRNYNPAHKAQVFDTLRREILAARLKVTLDEQLHRDTSTTVKRLAQMKLPPITRAALPVDRLIDRESISTRSAASGSFVRPGGSSAVGPDYTTADDARTRWEEKSDRADTYVYEEFPDPAQDVAGTAKGSAQDVAQAAKNAAQDLAQGAQKAASDTRGYDAKR